MINRPLCSILLRSWLAWQYESDNHHHLELLCQNESLSESNIVSLIFHYAEMYARCLYTTHSSLCHRNFGTLPTDGSVRLRNHVRMRTYRARWYTSADWSIVPKEVWLIVSLAFIACFCGINARTPFVKSDVYIEVL